MEVIGNQQDGDAGDRQSVESADHDDPAPLAPRSAGAPALRAALGAVVRAESLGLSGIIVELLSIGLTVPYLSYGFASAAQQPTDGVDFHPFAVVGIWLAVIAAAGLALGLLALARLGPAPGPVPAALAGAATIVGALMVLTALYMLGVSVTPQTPTSS